MPLAFIGGLVLQLPVQQVVILVVVADFFKVALGIHRLRSRKWINRLNLPDLPGQDSADTVITAPADATSRQEG